MNKKLSALFMLSLGCGLAIADIEISKGASSAISLDNSGNLTLSDNYEEETTPNSLTYEN